MHSIARALRLCLLSVFVLIAACSGGGGGGGDGGGGSAPGFSVSPGSLTFSAASTSSPIPPPQSITVTVTAGQVFFAAFFAGPAIANATFTITGQTTVRIDVFPASPAVLGAGTFTGTIRIVGCSDPNCNSQVANSPRDINVTYQIAGLVISPSSVSLSAIEGTNSAAVPVNVSNTSGSASWTTSISYAAGGPVGWLSVPANGGSLPATLNVSGGPLPLGTYSATVNISTAMHSLPIPVSYTVVRELSVAPASVTFAAVTGGSAPATSMVTVSAASGAASYNIDVSYGAGASGWLTVSGGSAPGNLSITPNTTNLAPGTTYTATITLTPSAGGTSVAVNVSYTLTASSLTLSPTSHTFNIDAASTATPAVLQRTVTTADTGASLTWTASASAPWLTVTPNGTSGDNAILTLDTAQMDALNAGASLATVTFTYSGPGVASATRIVSVTLNLNIPEINFVAPYVALPNTSNEVIVRGSGFNPAAGLELQLGGNSVPTYSVVSDTEIRVTHPPLPIGVYPVRLASNQLGLNRTRANLVVADEPTFAYAAISLSAAPRRLIYDPERRAIYTLAPDRVERFRLQAGSWVGDFLAIADTRDIALTPDGRELIVVTATNIQHVDPAALTVSFTSPPNPSGPSIRNHIAMGNDGQALVWWRDQFSVEYRYNVLTNVLTLFSPSSFYEPRPTTSSDGSRIIVGETGLSPPQAPSRYDVGPDQYTVFPVVVSPTAVSFDRRARNSIVDGTVFSDTLVPLGFMNFLRLGVISPPGTRAYAFIDNSPTGGTLRIYDLTSSNGSGGFNEIGTGIAIPDGQGSFLPLLSVTPNDRAVFIVRGVTLIVQPLP